MRATIYFGHIAFGFSFLIWPYFFIHLVQGFWWCMQTSSEKWLEGDGGRKVEKAFKTISEVAEASAFRSTFFGSEARFSQIKPVKRGGGVIIVPKTWFFSKGSGLIYMRTVLRLRGPEAFARGRIFFLYGSTQFGAVSAVDVKGTSSIERRRRKAFSRGTLHWRRYSTS